MVQKKALVLGASGLTGGQMLKILLRDEIYGQVTAYVRKPLKTDHPKLVQKIIDLDKLAGTVEADDIFCCLGTTIKKAGSEKAFEEVDLEFPLKVAKLQKEAGSSTFLVVSALGANANSSIFYNKVKGKMEEGLKAVGFVTLYILRPSVITGKRKEKRLVEKLVIGLLKAIDPLMIGPLKKYRTVSAKAIASAMLYYANKKETGTIIVLSEEIKEFEL